MKKQITVLVQAILLVNCTWLQVERPVSTAFIFTQTMTANIRSTTPQEKVNPTPAQTAKMERWMDYEHALAMELPATADAICEWEFLG